MFINWIKLRRLLIIRVMRDYMKNFLRFASHVQEAREIRRDYERRKHSKKFGAMSITFSIFAVPFAALAALGVIWLQGQGALLYIFVIILIAGAVAGALIMLLNALLYWLLQLAINKQAITWVTLAFLIISIAACIFLACYIIG